MSKPAPKLVKLFAALLVLGLIGIFAFKAQRHISGLAKKDRPSAPTAAAGDHFATASLSLDMLKALAWPDVDKLTQAVGTDSDKMLQVIQLTDDVQNPAAI